MPSKIFGSNKDKVSMSGLILSDILECFQPIFLWMRIWGIELDPRFHKRINLYGLIMVTIGIWTTSDHTGSIFWKLFLPSIHPDSMNVKSTTSALNIGIDYANHFLFIVGIYLAIFYVAQYRWKTLWNVVEELDSTLGRKLNYDYLRRLLYFGVVPVLGETVVLLYNLQTLSFLADQATYRIIVTYIATLVKAVPISALVLYCIMAWLNSLFYEQIYLDVALNLNNVNLRKWKHELNLASELVDKINKCFGLVLFVSVSHYFIDLISHFFYVVNFFTGPENIVYSQIFYIIHFGNIIMKFLFLWFVAYIPARIHRKVTKIAFLLHKIDNVEIDLQAQICLLWTDMIRNLPEITALGYFNIGLHLIPNLIGTIITYLIILYQFISSEKND